MAFKKENEIKRSIELISMIDMVFILLVFFLVTVFAMKISVGKEWKLPIPTPKNEPGHAQVFIQIKSADTYFLLDESAQEVTNELLKKFRLYPAERRNRKVLEQLEEQFTFRSDQFRNRLKDFVRSAANRDSSKYYIVIRCPDEIPYSAVIQIIAILSEAQNIRFGCIGGEMSDIRKGKVKTGIEKGRTVLKLDF
jgi:biopolymer transport protein ExbD